MKGREYGTRCLTEGPLRTELVAGWGTRKSCGQIQYSTPAKVSSSPCTHTWESADSASAQTRADAPGREASRSSEPLAAIYQKQK